MAHVRLEVGGRVSWFQADSLTDALALYWALDDRIRGAGMASVWQGTTNMTPRRVA